MAKTPKMFQAATASTDREVRRSIWLRVDTGGDTRRAHARGEVRECIAEQQRQNENLRARFCARGSRHWIALVVPHILLLNRARSGLNLTI